MPGSGSDSAPASVEDLETGTVITAGVYTRLADSPVGTASKVTHAVAAVCERIKLEHRYIGYSWEVSKLAFPVLAAMIASAASDAIIQRYMDKAGPKEGTAEELAAATQWISIFKLIQNAAAAPLGALYSLLSQKLGEMTWQPTIAKKGLFQLAQIGLMYTFFSSFLLAIPFYFSGDILRFCFGQTRAIALIDQKFLRFYLWGLLPFNLAAAFRPYLCVLDQRLWVTLLNLVSVGATYGFAEAFSKGTFGEEYSGLKGLSLTMTLRSVFIALACAVLIAFSRPSPKAKNKEGILVQLPQLALYKIFIPSCSGVKNAMREFFKVGLPLILKVLVEFGSSFSQSKLMSMVRTEALTVDSVVNSVLNWMMLCSSAFASAASQKVGFEKGVKNFKAAYAYGNIAIIISVMFALIACFVAYFQVTPLAGFFLAQKALDNPIVHHWLPTLMLLGVISQVFDALRITASSAYQGLMGKEGGSFWPMVWSSVGIVLVGCSSSAVMKFCSPWGVYGIAAGGIAGDFTAGALCLGLWLKKAVSEIKVHGGLPADQSVVGRHTRHVGSDGVSEGSDATTGVSSRQELASQTPRVPGAGGSVTSPLLTPAPITPTVVGEQPVVSLPFSEAHGGAAPEAPGQAAVIAVSAHPPGGSPNPK